MTQFLALILVAIFTVVIVLAGLKSFGKSSASSLKFIAVSLIVLEMFKFFYNASLFENKNPDVIFPQGETPSNAISLSIITVLCVFAAIGAFASDKDKQGTLKKISMQIVASAALIPLVFVIFNQNTYDRTIDTLGYLQGHDGTSLVMLGAIYYVQIGLAAVYSYLYVKEKNQVSLHGLLASVGVVLAVLGATVLTNAVWEAEFIFTDTTWHNIVVVALSVVIVALHFVIAHFASKSSQTKLEEGGVE